jgi:Sec-independent protein translocase protein TatA
MGQALSAFRKILKDADDETSKQAKQEFDVLAKALDSQLKEFENKLDM